MGVPVVYRKASEAALANYNWADISSGTGYVTFYGIDLEDDSKILSPNQATSTDLFKSDATVGAEAKQYEVNFDTEAFNLPRYIKGELLVTATMAANNNAGTNNSHMSTKIRILHVDSGSSETVIGTQVQTAQVDAPSGSAGVNGYTTTVPFTVDQHFKKGEMLRVEVEIWGAADAGTHFSHFYHSGDGGGTGPTHPTTGRVLPTNFIVNVPFDIDL